MEDPSVQLELATLLRKRPLGTTADINNRAVAYWDGREVRGFRIGRDGKRLEQEFDFDERTCNALRADLIAWMAAPRYTVRPELAQQLNGAPWLKRRSQP